MSQIDILGALSRPIAFQPIFVDVTGTVPGAVFLSQLKYWSERVPDGRDGWFYKSRNEWISETRLTRRNIEVARSTLVSAGILEFEKRGPSNISWYRLNTEKLREVLLALLQNNLNSTPQADLLTPSEVDSLLTPVVAVDNSEKSPASPSGEGVGHISPSCERPDVTKLSSTSLVTSDQANISHLGLVTSDQPLGTDVTNPLTENTNRSKNLIGLAEFELLPVDKFDPPPDLVKSLSSMLKFSEPKQFEILVMEFRLYNRDSQAEPRSHRQWEKHLRGWCHNRLHGVASGPANNPKATAGAYDE